MLRLGLIPVHLPFWAIALCVDCKGLLNHRQRSASPVSERSAHEPRSFSSRKSSLCRMRVLFMKSSRMTRRGKDGSNGFPANRPWMISH
jgi:hypothetical protein